MTATTPHPDADLEQRLHEALRAYHALAAALLTSSDLPGLSSDTHDAICDLVTAGYAAFDPADLTAADLPTAPPGTRSDELRRILQHPDPVPDAVYDEVLADAQGLRINLRRSLLYVAAQRPDITDDVIERSMPFANATLLNLLAANPAISTGRARKLAAIAAGDSFVGQSSLFVALARNPSLPADLVESFAGRAAFIRTEIAGRPDLPDELARTLATDPVENVRAAVARNPHIPDDIRVLAALTGEHAPA